MVLVGYCEYCLYVLSVTLFYRMLICGVRIAIYYFFFFFKQKTAYEMRISDWSSDVCSSDLLGHPGFFLDDDLRVARDAGGEIGGQRDRLAERVSVEEIERASCRERVCQYV